MTKRGEVDPQQEDVFEPIHVAAAVARRERAAAPERRLRGRSRERADPHGGGAAVRARPSRSRWGSWPRSPMPRPSAWSERWTPSPTAMPRIAAGWCWSMSGWVRIPRVEGHRRGMRAAARPAAGPRPQPGRAGDACHHRLPAAGVPPGDRPRPRRRRRLRRGRPAGAKPDRGGRPGRHSRHAGGLPHHHRLRADVRPGRYRRDSPAPPSSSSPTPTTRRSGLACTWSRTSVPARLNSSSPPPGWDRGVQSRTLIREGRVTVNGGPASWATASTRATASRSMDSRWRRARGLPAAPQTARRDHDVGDTHGRRRCSTRSTLTSACSRSAASTAHHRGAAVDQRRPACQRADAPRGGVQKTYLAPEAGRRRGAGAARAGLEVDGMTAPGRAASRDGSRSPFTRAATARFGGCARPSAIRSRLHRNRYGPLTVEGLAPGEWRVVEGAELAALRAEA